mgnify:CR=1 FL=1|jgi:hypothetical protein
MTAEEKAIAFVRELQEELISSNHSGFYIINEILGVAHKSFMSGYNEASRWRDPKEAPQNTDMLVKYTIVGDIFDYTCLEKDCDDTWHWRGEKWDVNKYPIIVWRPIE